MCAYGRFTKATAIKCYQCSAENSIDCSDKMIHLGGFKPESCDHVFEAEYCVKSTSLDGGYSPKRYCSSLDLGDYCNYVKQPGDTLLYRSCLFTCTGDGCNVSRHARPGDVLMYLIFCLVAVKFSDIISYS